MHVFLCKDPVECTCPSCKTTCSSVVSRPGQQPVLYCSLLMQGFNQSPKSATAAGLYATLWMSSRTAIELGILSKLYLTVNTSSHYSTIGPFLSMLPCGEAGWETGHYVLELWMDGGKGARSSDWQHRILMEAGPTCADRCSLAGQATSQVGAGDLATFTILVCAPSSSTFLYNTEMFISVGKYIKITVNAWLILN